MVLAKDLVNGATIVQMPNLPKVEYFHIELGEHQIIYANGTPSESYVDCDNRQMFANAAEYLSLHPKGRKTAGNSAEGGWRPLHPRCSTFAPRCCGAP